MHETGSCDLGFDLCIILDLQIRGFVSIIELGSQIVTYILKKKGNVQNFGPF